MPEHRIIQAAREAVAIARGEAEPAAMYCGNCGAEMAPGKALAQTHTGVPDFPGDKVVTISPGGPGRMIDCMKCPDCGRSVVEG